MNPDELVKLKYPIGRFSKPDPITPDHIKNWIDAVDSLPGLLRKEVSELTEDQLNWKYRPEGWTIRQVVHHLADSHLNSFTRFKLSLTEEKPVIKPYKENLWAELPDGKDADIQFSLQLLEGIHRRWVYLLKSLNSKQFESAFIHPDREGIQQLHSTLGLYAWHGKHHLAHIRNALASRGKNTN